MKLFLDSRKIPADVITAMYMKESEHAKLYGEEDWLICRDYTTFISRINEYGAEIKHVSFATDIENYLRMQNLERLEIPYDIYQQRRELCKSSYDCARYLRAWYEKRGLPLPTASYHNLSDTGKITFDNILYGKAV